MGVKVLVTSMIKLTECSVLITKAFMTSSWNTKPLPFSLAVRAKDLWWWGACRERTCDGGARAEKELVMVGCVQRKDLWWLGCTEGTSVAGTCWKILVHALITPHPTSPHLSLSDGSDAHQYHHPENEEATCPDVGLVQICINYTHQCFSDSTETATTWQRDGHVTVYAAGSKCVQCDSLWTE